MVSSDLARGLLRVAGLRHDLELGLGLEQHAQRAPHDRVIVGKDDPNRPRSPDPSSRFATQRDLSAAAPVLASGFARNPNAQFTRMTPVRRDEMLAAMNEQSQSSVQAPTSPTAKARAVILNALPKVLLLVALAYLGFYVYGLVLGVFSPGEMLGFTVVAVACAAAGIVHAIRIRRAMSRPRPQPDHTRPSDVPRDARLVNLNRVRALRANDVPAA